MDFKNTAAIITLALFLATLVVKILLDYHIASFLVKWFYWVPVRGVFRLKVPDISGDWNQVWDVRSKSFQESHERSSITTIYQLNKYCFAEFTSKGIAYIMFGKIKDGFLVGEWYDKNSDQGYYGAFEIEIVDPNTLKGKWLGHSKTKKGIKTGDWEWKRDHSHLKI